VWLSCPSALHNTFHTPTAWYSLFVPKVPLSTNQLTLPFTNSVSVLICCCLPLVLWHCWLGGRKGMGAAKIEVWYSDGSDLTGALLVLKFWLHHCHLLHFLLHKPSGYPSFVAILAVLFIKAVVHKLFRLRATNRILKTLGATQPWKLKSFQFYKQGWHCIKNAEKNDYTTQQTNHVLCCWTKQYCVVPVFMKLPVFSSTFLL